MTDGDALLQDIIDNPDCDTRRLGYADWLEENGQKDRAEYIRIGVRFWAIGFTPETAAEQTRMSNRMKHILEEKPLNPGWREIYPGAAMDKRVVNYTTRGMFEFVICPPADWVRWGDEILAKNPIAKVVLCARPEIYWSPHGWVQFVHDTEQKLLVGREVVNAAGELYGDDVSVAALHLRWPKKGITFTVPPAEEIPELGMTVESPTPHNMFDAEIERLIKGSKIPPPSMPKTPIGYPGGV